MSVDGRLPVADSGAVLTVYCVQVECCCWLVVVVVCCGLLSSGGTRLSNYFGALQTIFV
jgi:hypothetical protein